MNFEPENDLLIQISDLITEKKSKDKIFFNKKVQLKNTCNSLRGVIKKLEIVLNILEK